MDFYNANELLKASEVDNKQKIVASNQNIHNQYNKHINQDNEQDLDDERNLNKLKMEAEALSEAEKEAICEYIAKKNLEILKKEHEAMKKDNNESSDDSSNPEIGPNDTPTQPKQISNIRMSKYKSRKPIEIVFED